MNDDESFLAQLKSKGGGLGGGGQLGQRKTWIDPCTLDDESWLLPLEDDVLDQVARRCLTGRYAPVGSERIFRASRTAERSS
jgi:hypothetical protein